MNWHSLENKRILGTVPVEVDVKVSRRSRDRQLEQLNFTRPEKLRILEAVKSKPAAYAEALAILKVGKERLKKTPRADMDGFVPCADDHAREARYQRRQAEERAVYEATRTGAKRYDARSACFRTGK